jgi:hypothetical protein
LLDERNDPGNQIEWLEKELSQIEKDGGFCHIIAHIPPDECLHQFGIRYKALMERYQHIVRFSSMGHTHDEEFVVTRAINSTQGIGLNIVTPSGTTMTGYNPSFMVIDFDEEFMIPVNTHTYILNITEANINPDSKPVWYELHDWKNEYNLMDLSPSSMLDFTEKLSNYLELATLF